jgi:hypothetical protein
MPAPDIQAMFSLHVRASVRRGALLEECRRLAEAWHRAVAKRALAAAEEDQQLLTRLERAVRPG